MLQLELVILDVLESFRKIQFWQENGKVTILPLRIYKGLVILGKGILVIFPQNLEKTILLLDFLRNSKIVLGYFRKDWIWAVDFKIRSNLSCRKKSKEKGILVIWQNWIKT